MMEQVGLPKDPRLIDLQLRSRTVWIDGQSFNDCPWLGEILINWNDYDWQPISYATFYLGNYSCSDLFVALLL